MSFFLGPFVPMRILICCFFHFFIFFFLLLRPDVVAIVPVPVPFTSLSSHISSLDINDHSGECDELQRFSNSFTITADASMSCDNTSYAKTASWKKGASDCCSWDGVTCDPTTNDVIGLDLSCSWLRGPILSDSSLFSLRNVRQLNLAGNDFNGSVIPSKFGIFMEVTHLNLSNSGFEGQVPLDQMITHLPELISLDLSSYYGDGLTVIDGGHLGRVLRNLSELVLDFVDLSRLNPIYFSNLSSTLTILSLYGCNLQGKFPIDIFHLPNLRTLNLGVNGLTGTLGSLMNWSNPLVSLDLSDTLFQGLIPASIGNLTSMNHLDLSNSGFTGPIPPTLWKLAHLYWLDLTGNNFSGIGDLVGQECDGNYSMPRLQFLRLSDCGLTRFPYFLRSSAELIYLDLARNMISGSIPEWFWRVGRGTLKYLVLSSNNLTGGIPPSICQMRSLVELSFSGNALSGTLPTCLGNVSSLDYLNLRSNLLHGLLPRSVANFTNLQYLDLYSNQFHGYINEIALPSGLTDLIFSKNSFEGPLPVPPPAIESYDISNNNFSGGIPRNFFCNSTNVVDIDLSNNRFTGTIPHCLANCSQNLNILNLQANIFHGSIGEISFPNNLNSLVLSDNSFRGLLPIPPPTIQYYMASKNMFTGGIPHRICNATSIAIIDLSKNHLTASIPQCFSNFNASLTVLDIRENKLVGQIPDTFNNNIFLQTIRLSQNGLRGELPRSLAYCKYLEVLDVSGNELEGHFPYWLDTLPNLQVLSLRSNNFYGPVGNSGRIDRPFPHLRIFDLSKNGFSGPLPIYIISNLTAMKNIIETSGSIYMEMPVSGYYEDSIHLVIKGSDIELERILTVFTTIDLSSNLFEGEIPRAIGDLKALKGLNFSHNNLSGNIPSSIGNLTNLEWMDLSSNKLNETIPVGLALISSLGTLNLANNRLVGRIPQGRQFDTFTSGSFSGNPGLCGHPLPKACETDVGQTPRSTYHEQEKTESSSWIEWRAVLMGYACGLAFAISLWYIMMETGKPWWLVGTIKRWLLRIVEEKKLSRKTNRPCNNVHRKRSRGTVL